VQTKTNRRGRGALGAVAATVALLLPAASHAQQPLDTPTESEAVEALAQAEAVLSGQVQQSSAQTEPAADATVAMNQLAAALPELEGDERRRARALLARPTDGPGGDPFGAYPPGAPVASAASANFCVFWVSDPAFPDAPNLTDSNSNGAPDFVEQILAFAEHSRAIEVAPGPLGWEPPKPDGAGCGPNPSARADVYLRQIGAEGLFGYEVPEPGQGGPRSQAGYMVLDNDYSAAEYPAFADPLDAARVTFAHEYNHLLQQNYDSYQDIWMFESTATWAEEHVYPGINDYVNFVATYAKFPGEPITKFFADPQDPRQTKIYGAAVWNHWLATGGGGYGVGTVRRAWEISDVGKLKDFALGAYDRAIDAAGGRSFAREFVAFNAATAEWRTGFGGFPDAALYPDVKRKGKLGRKGKRFKLDHTAARFLDVAPGADTMRLKVKGPKGLKAGAALVGRGPAGVVAQTKMVDKRGRAKVKLGDAAAFERITAVLVNADMRVKGFAGTDWKYRKDNQRFTARLR
jgi:hypothetical protein